MTLTRNQMINVESEWELTKVGGDEIMKSMDNPLFATNAVGGDEFISASPLILGNAREMPIPSPKHEELEPVVIIGKSSEENAGMEMCGAN